MQAVILAAGEGTRMRPLTYEVPKPMLQVQGKPLLAYTIELLPLEITEVIMVVGYLGDQIKSYFKDNYLGKKITYVEQRELLGTGHALGLCKDILEDRFLVLAGDDMFCADDLVRALTYPRCLFAKEALAEEKRNYGLFTIDAEGNLVDIIEKELEPGEKGLVFISLAVLDKNFFKYDLVPIKGGKEYGLPQTVVKMAQDFPVKIVKTNYWLPIGYPDDLKRAEIHLKKHGVIK
jgi:bifunctional UDP-N-acetylglucosamine pyrophosphorylase/glucosamine-1-phosphate N-acetyltransferase